LLKIYRQDLDKAIRNPDGVVEAPLQRLVQTAKVVEYVGKNFRHRHIFVGQGHVSFRRNQVDLANIQAIVLPLDDGAAGVVADFVSMDSGGWTLDYTTVTGTGKVFWALAIEESAAALPFQPLFNRRTNTQLRM